MTEPKDGGPAFPSEGEGHGNPKYHSPCMTLRDWFAGQALCGIAESLDPKSIAEISEGIKGGRIIAQASYGIADAMIAAREQVK